MEQKNAQREQLLRLIQGKQIEPLHRYLVTQDIRIDDIQIGFPEGSLLHYIASHHDAAETFLQDLLVKNYQQLKQNNEPLFNIDQPNAQGNTSLHLAAKSGINQATKLLIQFDANTNLKNKEHQTAGDLASYYNHRREYSEYWIQKHSGQLPPPESLLPKPKKTLSNFFNSFKSTFWKNIVQRPQGGYQQLELHRQSPSPSRKTKED